MDLDSLQERSEKQEKVNKSFFKNIKKNQHRELDDMVHYLHQEVFDEINCLECANCCKSLGPRVADRDIDRMAMALRMKPHEFVSVYLKVDEDKDYVFKEMPCPFLMADNYCSIYENRPKACREYPHTDRKKFFQIHSLTIKNASTCPAVHEILSRLRADF